MRILHIISSLADGGAQACLLRLVSTDNVNTHYILALSNGGIYTKYLRSCGIPIIRCRIYSFFILYDIFFLFRFLWSTRPTLIQSWLIHSDVFSILLSLFCKVPYIWTLRTCPPSFSNFKFSTYFLAKLCSLFSYFTPSLIICCGPSVSSSNSHFGYSSNKLMSIPNGVDINQFVPSHSIRNNVRAALGLDDNIFLIGMVARFDTLKDFPTLLSSFSLIEKSYPNSRLILVGSGISQNNKSLVDLIKSYNFINPPILYGSVDCSSCLMPALDLHVLSSVHEGFPNVLCEAMSCQVPCVCTDVGDSAFIVSSYGWSVPSSNPFSFSSAIASAIDLSINDPSSWHSLRLSCRNHIIDNYTLDKMVLKYHSAWSSFN